MAVLFLVMCAVSLFAVGFAIERVIRRGATLVDIAFLGVIGAILLVGAVIAGASV